MSDNKLFGVNRPIKDNNCRYYGNVCYKGLSCDGNRLRK